MRKKCFCHCHENRKITMAVNQSIHDLYSHIDYTTITQTRYEEVSYKKVWQRQLTSNDGKNLHHAYNTSVLTVGLKDAYIWKQSHDSSECLTYYHMNVISVLSSLYSSLILSSPPPSLLLTPRRQIVLQRRQIVLQKECNHKIHRR